MPLKLFGRVIGNLFSSAEIRPISLRPGPSRELRREFSGVPAPEGTPSIQLIAAAWQCHDLYGEDMPQVAADLLEAGYDSPALRRLAGELQAGCMADVEDLVGRVFRELGIAYPLTDEQAQLIFTRQVAREVIAGKRDPWYAAYELESLTFRRFPDNRDLASLFALGDEWEWEKESQRYVPVRTEEIIEIFARLGSLSDDEIFRNSSEPPNE